MKTWRPSEVNFQQYILSQPNKYGIKIYTSVDAKVTGRQPDGLFRSPVGNPETFSITWIAVKA
jgi:hypothetical protein